VGVIVSCDLRTQQHRHKLSFRIFTLSLSSHARQRLCLVRSLSLFLLRNSCLQPTRYPLASYKLVFPNTVVGYAGFRLCFSLLASFLPDLSIPCRLGPIDQLLSLSGCTQFFVPAFSQFLKNL